jgi:cell division protein YceG involved in septum cleavage
VDAGVTNERLAAWVKAASKGITEDPAALTMKALIAVRKKIEATIKPGKQVTVEGTIMPDGYAVDNQAHIFDTDALDRGEFIEA